MEKVGQYITFKLAKTENVKFLVNKGSHTKNNVFFLIQQEIFYKNVHSKVKK